GSEGAGGTPSCPCGSAGNPMIELKSVNKAFTQPGGDDVYVGRMPMRLGVFRIALCLLALTLVGCRSESNTQGPGQQTGQGGAQGKVYKIGGFQMIPHPAPDEVRKGFVQALKDAGYKEGENVQFDFQNAQGEMSNTQLIAQKFVADKVDMIFAI